MGEIVKGAFISEPELIDQLVSRSKGALEYLYDRYSSSLYGIIYKIVSHEAVAEEVLQDTFIKIWDKAGDYDKAKGRLFTWMLNIARNLAIDKLRSKEFSQMGKTDHGFMHVSIEDSSKGNKVVDGIGMDNVLAQLPHDQRILIEMMYFQGYSQSEISDKLDIPLGTVKTRVRTGMLKLREILK